MLYNVGKEPWAYAAAGRAWPAMVGCVIAYIIADIFMLGDDRYASTGYCI